MINIIFILAFLISIFGYSNEYVDWCIIPNTFVLGIFLSVILICLICKREKLVITRGIILYLLLTIVLYSIGERNYYSQYTLLAVGITSFLFLGKNMDNQFLNEKQLARVFPLILVCEAIYGIVQFIQTGQAIEVRGHFDNTIGFAMTLSCGIPFLFFVIKNDLKLFTGIATIALGIIILALGLSASRSVLLALIISVFLYNYKYFRTRWNRCIREKRILILLFTIFIIFFLYWLKRDSANGRLVIWGTALSMLWKQPWGYGIGGVAREYMNNQAAFLSHVQDSYWLSLADNVNRVFNEYLAIGIELGCGAMFLAIGLFVYVVKRILIEVDEKKKIWLLLLFIILFISLFSYPLYYPVAWVVIGYSICKLIGYKEYFLQVKFTFVARYCIGIILLLGILYQHIELRNQKRWKCLAQACLYGNTNVLITDYPILYLKLKSYPMFLYNYGAELHYAKKYKLSNMILEQYVRRIADYDAWLLIADNYQKQNSYFQAIVVYQKAGAMCPGKFYPLYQQMNIFRRIGDKAKAIQVAKIIQNKRIKVFSSDIEYIKKEALNFLKDENVNVLNVKNRSISNYFF